jgi:hypothetical protein
VSFEAKERFPADQRGTHSLLRNADPISKRHYLAEVASAPISCGFAAKAALDRLSSVAGGEELHSLLTA